MLWKIKMICSDCLCQLLAWLSEMPGDGDRNMEDCSRNPHSISYAEMSLYLFESKCVDGTRENNDRTKPNFPTSKGRLGKGIVVIHVQDVILTGSRTGDRMAHARCY